MLKRIISLIFLNVLVVALTVPYACGQLDYALKRNKAFQNTEPYEVKKYDFTGHNKKKHAKNIILFISDGMGISQFHSGLVANRNSLYVENLRYIGFTKTQSADDFITDSAASGTAIACGKKTYNGAIGVDADTNAVTNIVELAEKQGLSTGLISTSSITHATPASFIAHNPTRKDDEGIAADFLKVDIDLFIGGGMKYFENRRDDRNLLKELEEKGYDVYDEIDKIKVEQGKNIACLADKGHMPAMPDRGDYLPQAVDIALKRLSQNEKGFFLMVEGSQIDWGGHQNNTEYIVREMLDLDKALGLALDFAHESGETLVLFTADHETGGMALAGGDPEKGIIEGEFTSKHHSGVMVPVFSAGPGCENYIGIYENTDLFFKMLETLEISTL